MRKFIYIMLALAAIQVAAGSILGGAVKDISDKRTDRINSIVEQSER